MDGFIIIYNFADRVVLSPGYHSLGSFIVRRCDLGRAGVTDLDRGLNMNRPNQQILLSDWLITSHVT